MNGVQILQGAQEVGKDIVFTSVGPLGEVLPCACVVKNAPITGRVGAAGGARTILQQVNQALDTPYFDGTGQEVRIQRVYVVSPYDLGSSARSSIQGALQKEQGRVVFTCGHELLQLFKTYWPDFLADEARALEHYLDQASKELSAQVALTNLGGIYDLGNIESSLAHTYIPLGVVRTLRSYELETRFEAAFPDREALSVPWSDSLLTEYRGSFSILHRSLRDLLRWGYLSDSLEETSELIEDFSRSLGEALHRSSQPVDTVGRETRWTLANTSGLTEISDRLRLRVKSLVEPFEKALKKNKLVLSAFAQDRTFSETIADSDVLDVMVCDDCIRSSLYLYQHCRLSQSMDLVAPLNLLDGLQTSLMIVGPPGSGKTSFSRWHALDDIEKFRSGTLSTVPIYVPVSRLAGRQLADLQDILAASINTSALFGELEIQASRREHGQVRIYLDGLDEMPHQGERQNIVRIIRNAVDNSKKYQVILTSREWVYEPALAWLPRTTLGTLGKRQLRSLAKRWLGSQEDRLRLFLRQLDSSPNLRDLMQSPLLATLTILVFRRTGSIPENKARLYTIFLELLAGGWDLAKGVLRPSKFGRDVKLLLLYRLATIIHEDRTREFDMKHLERAASSVFGRDSIDINALEKELLIDGLVTREGPALQFAHLSFQEFLTAKSFLGSPKPTEINRAIGATFSGDNWWDEVVNFYIGLSGNPRELKDWIYDQANRRDVPSNSPKLAALLRTLSQAYPGFPIEYLRMPD